MKSNTRNSSLSVRDNMFVGQDVQITDIYEQLEWSSYCLRAEEWERKREIGKYYIAQRRRKKGFPYPPIWRGLCVFGEKLENCFLFIKLYKMWIHSPLNQFRAFLLFYPALSSPPSGGHQNNFTLCSLLITTEGGIFSNCQFFSQLSFSPNPSSEFDLIFANVFGMENQFNLIVCHFFRYCNLESWKNREEKFFFRLLKFSSQEVKIFSQIT